MSKFSSPPRQAPDNKPAKPQRRRRISRHALQGLLSGAGRQRGALPADSPRVKASLPILKFLQEGAE